MDLIWPVLVLVGIERVSVDHTATAVTPLDFEYYPYSHSLLMSLVYSAIFGILAGFLKKSRTLGLVLGLTVFSHWVLDFLTHRPDLPLWFDSLKVGLGMWNSLGLTVVMEAALFGGGIFLFLRTSPRKSTREKIIFWGLISFLLLIYAGNIFGPQPPLDTSSSLIAGPALAMWLIVAWGYWVDRRIDPHPMA